jgi:hypothetical protein
MSDNSKEQARAQLDSIIKMVAATEPEPAAIKYVEEMTDDAVMEAMRGYEGFNPDDDLEEFSFDIDKIREDLTERLANGEEIDGVDFKFDEDAAWQAIDEDPLSVQVRGGWHDVGEEPEDEEFQILLCTGGPAVRITGDLDSYGNPTRLVIEHNDWFEPWTSFWMNDEEKEEVLKYCNRFIYR